MSELRDGIDEILRRAEPIMLHEMDSVALQNRIDNKYILHLGRLPFILNQVIDHYFILDINGHRRFSYNTLYFDTDDFRFFKDHHNGLTHRIKVRCREYVESAHVFFEIKRKYQGYRTDKFRKTVESLQHKLTNEEYEQIRSRYKKYEITELDTTLYNSFYRITLVSKKLTERVTLDFHIQFQYGDRMATLNNVAIVEVKQGKYDDRSPIVQLLKKERIYPNSISKYICGLLMVGNGMKYNAFKPLLQKINKIQSANGTH